MLIAIFHEVLYLLKRLRINITKISSHIHSFMITIYLSPKREGICHSAKAYLPGKNEASILSEVIHSLITSKNRVFNHSLPSAVKQPMGKRDELRISEDCHKAGTYGARAMIYL
eukprot:Gb_24264 [translate_table: standard]